MLSDLELLIRLQDVETRASAARKRIADAPGEIAALDAKLTATRDAVTGAKQAVADNQTHRKTLDKDLLATQQRLSKYKEQLMEVKTNTEYHAMQHQIEAAQSEVGKVEEQILVGMLELDELTAALKAAEAQLKSQEVSIAKERAGIEAEVAEQTRALAASDSDRQSILPSLSRGSLDLFERVAKARQGIAVALEAAHARQIDHERPTP
jgi:uncharacterized protein